MPCREAAGAQRLVLHPRDLVPRVAVRRQPGDHPLQPCGTRVPEAAPLHVPGGQRHRLRPVSVRPSGAEQGKNSADASRTGVGLGLCGNCPSTGRTSLGGDREQLLKHSARVPVRGAVLRARCSL